MAVGYFYQPIHLFIFCAVVAFGWWAIKARHSVPAIVVAPKWNARNVLVLGLGLSALAIIGAMSLDYLRVLDSTFS